LIKRWIIGTHQDSISPKHLEYYLDEFTFRFNRRTSRYRGKLFYRLLQQAVVMEPVPYTKLIE
ncbi:MAG: transposase, partial [Candidatus Omnitrophica bacterium]|nr:transposase [Candidatus Omnitrophota bacterium]